MPVFSPPFDIDAIGTLSNPSSFSFTKMGIHGHFSCLNRLISLQVIPQTIESHHPKDREPFFYWLVLWNMAFMTFHILGMSSSQLTNSYFLEGYGSTTNQFITWYHDFRRISMFGISFGGCIIGSLRNLSEATSPSGQRRGVRARSGKVVHGGWESPIFRG